MRIRKQNELRIDPMANPVMVRVIMEKEMRDQLKAKAAEMDTTLSELIRVQISRFLLAYPPKQR